jgi:hypothetical protein
MSIAKQPSERPTPKVRGRNFVVEQDEVTEGEVIEGELAETDGTTLSDGTLQGGARDRDDDARDPDDEDYRAASDRERRERVHDPEPEIDNLRTRTPDLSARTPDLNAPAPDLNARAPDADSASEASQDLQPLFAADVANTFRARWTAVQSSFVDNPKQAVKQGDELVSHVLRSLGDTFANERRMLEGQMERSGEASTETLRLALRRYRSFFNRLLEL